ncbi:MAG: DUF4169 family protein [Pseudomonadota bacterium]
MAEPVNLRWARKERARTEKRRKADENATRHGLSKAERVRQGAEQAQVARVLDHAKREKD